MAQALRCSPILAAPSTSTPRRQQRPGTLEIRRHRCGHQPGQGYFPGRLRLDPRDLTNVGDTLFFSADDGTNGSELWKSDGTAAGTTLVEDINPGSSGSSYPRYLTNVGGTLYFQADDGTNGSELWKSDGTAAGTVPGQGYLPRQLPARPRSILTTSAAPSTSRPMTAPTAASSGNPTAPPRHHPGQGYSAPAAATRFRPTLTTVGGTLYFIANDGTNGSELWKSDGTAAGTVLVKDIRPVRGSSRGTSPTSAGTLYFRPMTAPTAPSSGNPTAPPPGPSWSRT